MTEIEVPTEGIQEEIQHHAHESKDRWSLWVALSSALLAALAAVAALLAGHHANEAMREQIQSSNQWAYYQAKGVKASVLSSKLELLDAMGKWASKDDEAKLEGYKKEQESIKAAAEEGEKSAEAHMSRHVTLARGVTLFQVAIAIAAISVLTRRRWFWLLGLAFGAGGVVFLVLGLL